MDGSTTKNKVMIFFIFLMLLYFVIQNFLNVADHKNENNSYVSLNLIFTTKEEYLTEYIGYIQNEKYTSAFNMLDDSTKEYFKNSVDEFKEYAIVRYNKKIATKAWKFKYTLKHEESFKKMNVYVYEVMDENREDKSLIDTIKINEYAVNVFKICLV